MIDIQASEQFMAAPWLGEIDTESKRAILTALVERGAFGCDFAAQDQPNDHLSFLIGGTALDRACAGQRSARGDHATDGAGGVWIDVVFPAAASERVGPGDFGRVDAVAVSSGARRASREEPAGCRISGGGGAARFVGAVRSDG